MWQANSSGKVISWPSYRGIMKTIIPVTIANATVTLAPGGLSAVAASGNLQTNNTPLVGPGLSAGVILVVKDTGNTTLRLTGRVGGGTTGWWIDTSNRINLEAQAVSNSGQWQSIGTRGSWNVYGFLFTPAGEGTPHVFANGQELSRLNLNYTAPLSAYDGIGNTLAFDNFSVGEWFFYQNPTVQQMKDWTLEASYIWGGV
jgi:hypothetical protein